MASILGHDGRACMATLLLNWKLDGASTSAFLKELWDHCVDTLPVYARPVFLRITRDLEMTSTIKQTKVSLKKEGFEPLLVSDDLFYIDKKTSSYLPLTEHVYRTIVAQQMSF